MKIAQYSVLFMGLFIAAANANASCFLMGNDLCGVSCRGEVDQITNDLVQTSSADEQVCAVAFADDIRTLNALLTHGVDINTRTTTTYKDAPSGRNALFDAIFKGRTEFLPALIEKGINVNSQDAHGSTPLMEAVWSDDVKMVEALLQAGALPNLKDNFGMTALCYAKSQFFLFRSEDVISTLERAGAVCED